MIWYGGGSNADIKLAFTVPTGASLIWGAAAHGDVSNTAWVASGNWKRMSTSGGELAFGIGSGDGGIIHIRGLVRVDATAGNLQLQWAQNTSSTAVTDLVVDSWLAALKR